MGSRPHLQDLWAAFPDHVRYPTLADLYTTLGGTPAKNVNVPGFGPNGNTCASRLSVAFNSARAPITAKSALAVRADTLTAEDGSRIIYRVADFRRYLQKEFGKPVVDSVTPFDDKILRKKGIIAFSIAFQDATGHIALWNGRTYREPEHDNYAAYAKTARSEFWELP